MQYGEVEISTEGERGLPFTLEQFTSWYEEFATTRLQPAKDSAKQTLVELLKEKFDDSRMRRIRVSDGRIKEPLRAYRRLAEKAADRATGPDDACTYLRDLVGLRIICTNLEDVDSVSSLLKKLPAPNEESKGLSCKHDPTKDYISNPKASGYRSIHFDLFVPVLVPDGFQYIRCELQVRTLLQDSWGELTHEDTYKPGSEVPHIITVMSQRMADVMATLDDMAQDLRNVLTEEAEAEEVEVETMDSESSTPSDLESPDVEQPTTTLAAEARAFLSFRAKTINAPISFAELAFETRRELGADAAHYWFGYGNFKNLLLNSVPQEQVALTGPGYVIPDGSKPDDFALLKSRDHTSPAGIQRLRKLDNSFPAIEAETWPLLFAAVSEATGILAKKRKHQQGNVSGFHLPIIARDATATGENHNLGRNALNYVSRYVQFSQDLDAELSPTEIANIFVDAQTSRLRRLGTRETDIEETEAWLRGYSPGERDSKG
ncbi:MAG: hypothetical protein J0H98_06285 [Solirubrobacterales bacterium]|nr:hypothetical protein [Solirubrobacterales bacterium]